MFDITVQPATEATPMCHVMQNYRSDKGNSDNTARHNYTRFYDRLFSPRRNDAIKIFELGLFYGASVRAWREYFPNGEVFGADIEQDKVDLLRNEPRIKAYCLDELDFAAVDKMWADIGPVDIIIDDALHAPGPNIAFFYRSWAHLKPGGVYVVEDVRDEYLLEYGALQDSEDFESRMVQMPVPPGSDADDNNLLCIKKQVWP